MAVSQDSAASLAIRAKLQEKMSGFYADKLPLNQTIDSLSKATGMTISVDWKALEIAGINRDTPITIKMNWAGISIPARTVLATILFQIDGDRQIVGYTLDDGVVAVSTRQSFEATGLQFRNASAVMPLPLQPQPPTSVPDLAPPSPQPAGSAPATTSSADADSIQFESAYIIASRDFMDDFRVGWDLNLPAYPRGGPQVAGMMHVSMIDEWTRNLLLTAVQRDKTSKISDPSKTVIPDGKSGDLTWPLNESFLNSAITTTASADGRWVVMKATFSIGKSPTSAGPDTRTTADHQTTAGASVVGSMSPISVPNGVTLLIDAGEISPPVADPAATSNANTKPGRMLILIRTSPAGGVDVSPSATPKTGAPAASGASTRLIDSHELEKASGSAMTNVDSKLAEAKDKKVREQLEMPVQRVNADKLAFEKVINSLRGATHTDIFVNWPVLAKEGINRGTPVTISLREIPFRKALTTILAEVGGVTSNLGYAIDNGIIIISTRDDLATRQRQTTQVYDIHDLLNLAANRAPPFSVPFDATKLPYRQSPPAANGRQGRECTSIGPHH